MKIVCGRTTLIQFEKKNMGKVDMILIKILINVELKMFISGEQCYIFYILMITKIILIIYDNIETSKQCFILQYL